MRIDWTERFDSMGVRREKTRGGGCRRNRFSSQIDTFFFISIPGLFPAAFVVVVPFLVLLVAPPVIQSHPTQL